MPEIMESWNRFFQKNRFFGIAKNDSWHKRIEESILDSKETHTSILVNMFRALTFWRNCAIKCRPSAFFWDFESTPYRWGENRKHHMNLIPAYLQERSIFTVFFAPREVRFSTFWSQTRSCPPTPPPRYGIFVVLDRRTWPWLILLQFFQNIQVRGVGIFCSIFWKKPEFPWLASVLVEMIETYSEFGNLR